MNNYTVLKSINTGRYEILLAELSNGQYRVVSIGNDNEAPTISDNIADLATALYVFDVRREALEAPFTGH
jgi:hypothetical protein